MIVEKKHLENRDVVSNEKLYSFDGNCGFGYRRKVAVEKVD